MTSTGHGSADATDLLPSVARALEPDVPDLVRRVVDRILDAVPELGADVDLRHATERSIEANIRRILSLFADPDLPVDGPVPREARELGTTLLRRGGEPGTLVHAYLAGQNAFLRAWIDELTQRAPPDADVIGMVERSTDRLSGWIDFAVERLMHEWDAERERWVGGTLARRTELAHELLAGDGPGLETASRGLGYELDRCLTAAVIWCGLDTDPLDGPFAGLETAAETLAAAVGAPRALTLPVGAGTLWAWVGSAAAPDLDVVEECLASTLPEDVGVALGTPGTALAGFRRSHEEALWARRVAELGGTLGVVRYDRVEVVSLLAQDVDRLDRFVDRTLGDLIADDAATARVRETLLAWLEEGGNARRAADRLHTHKNTVLYRVQRARQILGHDPGDDRLALQLALVARSRLRLADRTNTARQFGRAAVAGARERA